RFGLAPDLEARHGRKPLAIEGGGFSYQKLAANYRPPTAHRQPTQEEIYIAIAGSGRVKIGNEVRDVRHWDARPVPRSRSSRGRCRRSRCRSPPAWVGGARSAAGSSLRASGS